MPETLACATIASDGLKTRVSCSTDSMVDMKFLLRGSSIYSTAIWRAALG